MPFLSRLFPLFKIALAQTEDQKSKNPPYDSARSSREKIVTITKAEFFEPIQDEYVRYLSQLPPEEIYDNYNPGPTNPDGSVNFECHCVSHLVASPCGFAFRKALTCQKAASKEEQEAGACAEEFMNFIKCAIDTQCFRRNVDGGEEEPDGEEK